MMTIVWIHLCASLFQRVFGVWHDRLYASHVAVVALVVVVAAARKMKTHNSSQNQPTIKKVPGSSPSFCSCLGVTRTMPDILWQQAPRTNHTCKLFCSANFANTGELL